jgi:hypothetical protein
VRESLNNLLNVCAAMLLLTSPLSSPAAPLGFNGYFAGMSRTQAAEAGVENCREATSASEDKRAMYCDVPAASRKLGEITARRATLEFMGPQHDSLNQIRLEFVKPVEAVKAAMLASYGTPRYDGQTYVWEQASQTVSLNILSRFNAVSCVTFDHDLSPDKARANAMKLEALKKQLVKQY